MTSGAQVLRELINEGRAHLGRPRSAVESPFVSEHDATGRVTAVAWHPRAPVVITMADLESLGEVSQAPRMPDTGDLVVIIYHPTGRTLLRVREFPSAEVVWAIESATYTTL